MVKDEAICVSHYHPSKANIIVDAFSKRSWLGLYIYIEAFFVEV